MSTALGGQYSVYVGLWTNWSRGQILGSTLTLKRQDADLLIAFLAVFIAFISTRTWRILCFIFHRAYSTSKAQVPLYNQCQAVLRNSSSPAEGIRQLLQLARVNRRSREVFRPLSVAITGMLCAAGFVVASGFSSRISTAVGNEMLIESVNCGLLDPAAAPIDSEGYVAALPYRAGRVNSAANYAQQCYSDDNSTGLLDCGRFVIKRLPVDVDGKAACPFNNDICRDNSTNLRLDSGFIDSHRDLGLNAPANERILWRNVLECGPLDTTRFTSQDNTTEGHTLYHYGNISTILGDRDYVFRAASVEAQYASITVYDSLVTNSNYLLSAIVAPVRNGTSLPSSDFIPLESLARHDADLFLFFLSGNGVVFLEPTDDGWYRTASAPTNISVLSANVTTEHGEYLPLEPASPLGCVNQHQFCTTAVQGTNGCGPLASLRDAIAGAAPLFNTTNADFVANVAQTDTQARFLYFMNTFFSYDATIAGVVRYLGPTGLHSQRKLINGRQAPLEANQWQLDIAHLWDISKAATQAVFIDTAHGPTDPRLSQLLFNYTTPELKNLCSNQKIQITAYASFSVFGLFFILVVGLLIILSSYLLETIFSLLAKRKGYKRYVYLEWVTNATLQLQRLAHEGLGLGTWSKCTDPIPVTQPGELLGYLDISDPGHPVIRSLDKTRTIQKPEESPESPAVEDSQASESSVVEDSQASENPVVEDPPVTSSARSSGSSVRRASRGSDQGAAVGESGPGDS